MNTSIIKQKTKQNPNLTAALIISFLAPVIIMLLVFLQRGIYPFGDRSFLRTDLYHQYAPFFQEFHRKLTKGESLVYSLNIGAGTNFTALYAYYLASPLNWLVALVPEHLVIEFITYQVVFKIGLCGLTFTWYLHKHTRSQSLALSLFGIAYALSGYLAAYSWNIMWLDCIFLFPLVILGLERLFYEGRYLLYTVTLALSILSNYYISIMTCLFLVLYFIFLAATEPKFHPEKLFKRILCFGCFSLLAGALAACVLIPEIYALATTASSKSTFPSEASSYFSILDMLARHLMFVEVEEGLDHWPNLFCGVFVFLLIPLYVMNRRFSYKEKVGYLVLTFFMLASFSINILNYIWHGFHYPNSLPCRQSYLYIFMLLVMSCKGLMGIADRNVKQIVSVFWVSVSVILLVQAVCTDDAIPFEAIWISLIFVGLYALLLYLYKQKINPFLLTLIALVLIITENTVNTSETSVTTITRSTYMDIDEAADILLEKVDSGEFYRVEKTALRTKNDGAWLGYHSASTFSSMSYASMRDFYKNMGMEASTNAFSSTGASPFTYSLLNVRYLLSSDQLSESPLYQLVDSQPYFSGGAEKTLYLYENLYTLPLGFMLPESMSEWNCTMPTPFSEQASFADKAAGVSSLYTMLSTQASGRQCQATVSKSGQVFAYISGSAKEVTASHGSFSKDYNNVNRGYLLNLGYCEEGETITITNKDTDGTVTASMAVFEEENLIRTYEALSPEGLQVEYFDSNHITGSVTTKGGLLFLSIPYDKGWSMKVDGEAVSPEIFAETFLCVTLPEGTHTIELSYMPQGLVPGLLISGTALLILLGIFGFLFYRRKKAEAALKQELAESLQELEDSDH